MATKKQVVYFVSESTGITAESLGSSLLSQFPDVSFQRHHIPFVNTRKRAEALATEIKHHYAETKLKPLVFATMADSEIDQIISQSPCHYYELFTRLVSKIADDINVTPTHGKGLQHGLVNPQKYDKRMEVVNYALDHDDAISLNKLDEADVILLGVSRCGKTPTSLYLALQFSLRAANYPLTADNFSKDQLPQVLIDNKNKLIALTISPARLAEIRQKRRPNSLYAKLSTCQSELRQALQFYQQYQLTVLDTTARSIEELAARIIQIREKTTT